MPFRENLSVGDVAPFDTALVAYYPRQGDHFAAYQEIHPKMLLGECLEDVFPDVGREPLVFEQVQHSSLLLLS